MVRPTSRIYKDPTTIGRYVYLKPKAEHPIRVGVVGSRELHLTYAEAVELFNELSLALERLDHETA